MTIKRVVVKKSERGILLRNGDFAGVLQPGKHWLVSAVDRLHAEIFGLAQTAFTHEASAYLMAHEPDVLAAEFVQVDLGETQVGLRSENGVLIEVLAPGTRRLYWKGLIDVKIEVIDIDETAVLPPTLVTRLIQTQMRERGVIGLDGVLSLQVPESSVGILIIDGKVQPLLQPGAHAYWKFNRHIAIELIDLRMQVLDVSGQEILTKDKVGLRLNLSATWRYTDVLKAFMQLQKPAEHLYRALQFGLRAAVGTRTLDELLENKSAIDDSVMAHVTEHLSDHGMALDSAGVKDIVLPGDMKVILAQVVQAEKAAQANVIRRREETAATRSLLNTAKVMEDNPVALRMKELETLERVAERIDKITVFGGLDQVLNGLVTLRQPA
ncbi:slipin family protein [Robbsia sp. KACC 23696]|uniref:slipin family protein n=1 Tax=Robbsia sp. KACC 23696 TaxID=3149231 RepID=UPI00325BAAAA